MPHYRLDRCTMPGSRFNSPDHRKKHVRQTSSIFCQFSIHPFCSHFQDAAYRWRRHFSFCQEEKTSHFFVVIWIQIIGYIILIEVSVEKSMVLPFHHRIVTPHSHSFWNDGKNENTFDFLSQYIEILIFDPIFYILFHLDLKNEQNLWKVDKIYLALELDGVRVDMEFNRAKDEFHYCHRLYGRWNHANSCWYVYLPN